MKEGHIKRMDNGDAIYDVNGNRFIKSSHDGNYYYFKTHAEITGDDEKLTKDELLKLDVEIWSYTYEQKQALIRDLSARQCYDTMMKRVGCKDVVYKKLHHVEPNGLYCLHIGYGEDKYASSPYEIEDWKPVLKSPDKLTGDERKEYEKYLIINGQGCFIEDYEVGDFVAWCYEHHIDINDLIRLGIAEELTEDNNPYKQ